MSTDNIFSNQDSQATPDQNSGVSNTTQPNQSTDYTTMLSQIKNEMGLPKYRDTAEALNGLKHAQEYIPQLKGELSNKDRELEALKQENARLRTVEETVARLTERQNNPVENTPQAPVYDDQKIAELINQTLSRKEIETQQKANLGSVVSALQASFGAEAEKVFYNKAQELGMSVADVNRLAAQSPSAVLQLMGVKQGQVAQQQRPAPSGVNTTNFQASPETKIARNNNILSVGATTSEMMVEHRNSKDMVTELHAQGLSMRDLADPKIYAKYFK